MKKIMSLSSMVLLASFASHAAMADDSVKIRAGMSNNTYTLVDSNNVDWAKAPYRATNLGLTLLTSETGYIDLSYSKGTGDYDRPLYTGTMTRSDYAVVMGGNKITDSGKAFNLYFGWKSGSTMLDPQSSAPTGSYTYDFSSSGLVVGGGVAIPVKIGGAFSVTAGLGIMSGQNTGTPKGGTATTYKADYTFGFNLGLGYTLPISENVGISADYKASSYTYTFDSGLTSEYDLQEKVSGFGVALYAKF